MPSQPGIFDGRCVWDPGGGRSDVSLSVMQSSDPTMAMLVTRMPFDGEPIDGLGDRSGVSTQGNYNVEVGVLVGARRMVLSVSGLGVVAKKDAVVAAARVAAAKLR
jgi:hypothetical protein